MVWHGGGMAKTLTRRPPSGPVPPVLPTAPVHPPPARPAVTPPGDPADAGTAPTAERTALLAQVEGLLRDLVSELAPEPAPAPDAGRRGPGRPRILPALCLWAGVVVCLLHGGTAYAEVWRLLTLVGLWEYPRFPLTDQAIYKRLAQDDGSTLRRLFTTLSGVLAARLVPVLRQGKTPLDGIAPWAPMIVGMDETTLDKVARLLPALRAPGTDAPALLAGRLASVFDGRAQQFVRVDYREDAQQNEKVACRGLLADLPRWSLLLFDLGYFAFQWFDDLTEGEFWWVSRLRAKTSYTVRHVFYHSKDAWDGLVYLGAYRADRAAHPVRLVRFTVGATTWAYVTNVLDPARLSLHDIAVLYARRWDIELAFLLIKRELGLHLIWSPKRQLILHQVYAVLCIAQIVQALRLELAVRAGIDPFEVSLPLFLRYLPLLIAKGEADPLAVLIARGEAAGILRPSRRTHPVTPPVDQAAYRPAPPDALRSRTPRYAHRNCASRTN